MPSKIPPQAAPSYSANDNGPLTSGQVKLLKIAIATMGVMIVAALLAIVGRVIYLSAVKKKTVAPVSAVAQLAPQHSLALPNGAIVKNMSLENNRLLIHYETSSGAGAAILDLASGKTISRIAISVGKHTEK